MSTPTAKKTIRSSLTTISKKEKNMLKKTVTYTNVDGATISKDLYFNISSHELLEKEALSNQTYSEKLKEIAASDKLSDIYPTVMEFIEEGYGVRTEDGDFEKDPAAWEKFKKSLAYQALMEELLMNPENNGNRLADFINGMLPPGLVRQAQEQNAVPGFRPGADVSRPTPPVAGEQPVYVEPVVQEPPVQYRENLPENGGSTTVADQPGEIQQTSQPRTPELPGQAPQQY